MVLFLVQDLDDALHVKEVSEGIYSTCTIALCEVYTALLVDVYEVGVHIADVSYFVKEDSALDQVASQRATSVYLVQRVSHTTRVHVISTWRMGSDSCVRVCVCVQVVPMLPRLLCEQLCSLNPNQVISTPYSQKLT